MVQIKKFSQCQSRTVKSWLHQCVSMPIQFPRHLSCTILHQKRCAVLTRKQEKNYHFHNSVKFTLIWEHNLLLLCPYWSNNYWNLNINICFITDNWGARTISLSSYSRTGTWRYIRSASTLCPTALIQQSFSKWCSR